MRVRGRGTADRLIRSKRMIRGDRRGDGRRDRSALVSRHSGVKRRHDDRSVVCIHAITGPPTGSNFTKRRCSRVRMRTGRASAIRQGALYSSNIQSSLDKINRALFCCPVVRSRTAVSQAEADGSGR